MAKRISSALVKKMFADNGGEPIKLSGLDQDDSARLRSSLKSQGYVVSRTYCAVQVDQDVQLYYEITARKKNAGYVCISEPSVCYRFDPNNVCQDNDAEATRGLVLVVNPRNTSLKTWVGEFLEDYDQNQFYIGSSVHKIFNGTVWDQISANRYVPTGIIEYDVFDFCEGDILYEAFCGVTTPRFVEVECVNGCNAAGTACNEGGVMTPEVGKWAFHMVGSVFPEEFTDRPFTMPQLPGNNNPQGREYSTVPCDDPNLPSLWQRFHKVLISSVEDSAFVFSPGDTCYNDVQVVEEWCSRDRSMSITGEPVYARISEGKFACPTSCSQGACVEATCGNGVLDAGEACDDSDYHGGDGCASCQVETGYTCSEAEPSVCISDIPRRIYYPAGSGPVTPISDCAVLESDTTYSLTDDIFFTSDKCFEIDNKQNIVFDCQGNTIDANELILQDSVFSILNSEDITIKNCIFDGSAKYVKAVSSNRINVLDNDVVSQFGTAVFFNDVQNSSVEGNQFFHATFHNEPIFETDDRGEPIRDTGEKTWAWVTYGLGVWLQGNSDYNLIKDNRFESISTVSSYGVPTSLKTTIKTQANNNQIINNIFLAPTAIVFNDQGGNLFENNTLIDPHDSGSPGSVSLSDNNNIFRGNSIVQDKYTLTTPRKTASGSGSIGRYYPQMGRVGLGGIDGNLPINNIIEDNINFIYNGLTASHKIEDYDMPEDFCSNIAKNNFDSEGNEIISYINNVNGGSLKNGVHSLTLCNVSDFTVENPGSAVRVYYSNNVTVKGSHSYVSTVAVEDFVLSGSFINSLYGINLALCGDVLIKNNYFNISALTLAMGCLAPSNITVEGNRFDRQGVYYGGQTYWSQYSDTIDPRKEPYIGFIASVSVLNNYFTDPSPRVHEVFDNLGNVIDSWLLYSPAVFPFGKIDGNTFESRSTVLGSKASYDPCGRTEFTNNIIKDCILSAPSGGVVAPAARTIGAQACPYYFKDNVFQNCNQVPYCGNSIVEGDEQCDDGNWVRQDQNGFGGDGCGITGEYGACKVQDGYTCSGSPSVCNRAGSTHTCGNGAIESPEACDDFNTAPGDGCSNACIVENGYTCTGSVFSYCSETVIEVGTSCGDGTLGAGEACDDGNTAPGDGCSSACHVENNYECPTTSGPCSIICGNGVIDGDEACDDDNTAPGDGCNLCLVEESYTCSQDEPSFCIPSDPVVELTSNYILENAFARIEFSQPLTLSSASVGLLPMRARLLSKRVEIDSDALSEFKNIPARIIFKNVTLNNPQVYYDEILCAADKCTAAIYDSVAKTLEFNVTSFSNYSLVEGPYCGDTICNGGESCSTCAGDCGGCNTGSPGGPSNNNKRTCASEWECEWGACDGFGERYVCVDLNSCGTGVDKPIEMERLCGTVDFEDLPADIEVAVGEEVSDKDFAVFWYLLIGVVLVGGAIALVLYLRKRGSLSAGFSK